MSQPQNVVAWPGLFICLSSLRVETCPSLGCRSMGLPVHTHTILSTAYAAWFCLFTQLPCPSTTTGGLGTPDHKPAMSQHHHAWARANLLTHLLCHTGRMVAWECQFACLPSTSNGMWWHEHTFAYLLCPRTATQQRGQTYSCASVSQQLASMSVFMPAVLTPSCGSVGTPVHGPTVSQCHHLAPQAYLFAPLHHSFVVAPPCLFMTATSYCHHMQHRHACSVILLPPHGSGGRLFMLPLCSRSTTWWIVRLSRPSTTKRWCCGHVCPHLLCLNTNAWGACRHAHMSAELQHSRMAAPACLC